MRVVVANRLSNNASDWGSYLSKYNSGTGNKQWLIIDVDKFKRKINDSSVGEREKNFFWVAEQLPGHFKIDDLTENLINSSYWASYGLPFYKVTDFYI